MGTPVQPGALAQMARKKPLVDPTGATPPVSPIARYTNAPNIQTQNQVPIGLPAQPGVLSAHEVSSGMPMQYTGFGSYGDQKNWYPVKR